MGKNHGVGKARRGSGSDDGVGVTLKVRLHGFKMLKWR